MNEKPASNCCGAAMEVASSERKNASEKFRPLMSIPEIAGYFRVSYHTIWRLARAGGMSIFRIGGNGFYRARREDIESYEGFKT